MPTRCTTSPCERSPPPCRPVCTHVRRRFCRMPHGACRLRTFGGVFAEVCVLVDFVRRAIPCVIYKMPICISGRLRSLALSENGPLLLPKGGTPVARRPPCERALAQASRAHRSTLNRTEVSNKYHSPAAVDNHAPPGTVRNPTNTILSNRAGVRFSITRAKHGNKKGPSKWRRSQSSSKIGRLRLSGN